jgi:hypothetical protein
MKKASLILSIASGCATTPPTPIGGDTYYMTKTNGAGAFGNVDVLAGHLMAQGCQFCAAKGKEFELVSSNTDQPAPFHMGVATITFKCVLHAHDPGSN